MAATLGPHPQGTSPSLLQSLAAGVKGMDWPGNLERAGNSALSLGMEQYKLGEAKSVRDVLQRNAPKGTGPGGEVTNRDSMNALGKTYNELLTLGTPTALTAADQVAKGHALFKDIVPSSHNIQWEPVTVGGKPMRQAMNPITGKPVLGDDGKPMLLDEGKQPPGMTEAQAEKFEQDTNEHFVTHMKSYADKEGAYKAFLSAPLPTQPQAKSMWVKQAQILANAASASAAEDPSMAAMAAGLSIISDKLGKALQTKGDVSSADMQEMLQQVKLAHDQNRISGKHVFDSYDHTARDMGYTSPMIEQYRGEWGVAGPAATPGARPGVVQSAEEYLKGAQ
jgi:hypothetical protein